MGLQIERHNPDVVRVEIPDGKPEAARCAKLTKNAAMVCAAVSAEPIPWVDTALILPMQLKLVADIGKVYGFDLTSDRARNIAFELGSAFLYGYASRQFVRGLSKLTMPVLGGMVTAPVVYASTHTLGHLAERHFRALRGDLPALSADAQKAWRNTLLEEGKRLARQLTIDDLRKTLGMLVHATLRRRR